MVLYFLKKFACNFFALLLGLAIVATSLSVLFVGYFSSESFIQQKIEQYEDDVISELDNEVKKLSKTTGLKETAFVGAVNKDNFYVISSAVTKNLRYCYVTDFSDNVDLYNIYSASISDTSKNGGKTLKSNEVSRYASLAVSTACKVLNQNGTANVIIFNSMQNRFFVFAVITSIGLVIMSIVALELINKGRHRKFSYIGMGIITSGYLLVAGTIYVQKMNYINKNVFLAFEPYNNAVREAVSEIIAKNVYIGAVLFAAGLIILAVNYNYFRKKSIKTEKEKEFNKRLATDFLQYDEPSVSHRLSDEEGFEKEVTKINFDEE